MWWRFWNIFLKPFSHWSNNEELFVYITFISKKSPLVIEYFSRFLLPVTNVFCLLEFVGVRIKEKYRTCGQTWQQKQMFLQRLLKYSHVTEAKHKCFSDYVASAWQNLSINCCLNNELRQIEVENILENAATRSDSKLFLVVTSMKRKTLKMVTKFAYLSIWRDWVELDVTIERHPETSLVLFQVVFLFAITKVTVPFKI